MEYLEDLVMSGRIVDIMLVFLVLETAWLAWRHQRTGRGLSITLLIANAGAGGSLMLALKAVLSGASLPWIVSALLASLFFHSTDLALRWRAAPPAAEVRP
jgi:hypothetical protein